MNNRIYISSNALTMVESQPLNWRRESVYANSNIEPYFYSIYVGGIANGHICNFQEETMVLTISNIAYSSDDPPLKFKVDSIEDAGNIVAKFAKGMQIDFTNTIYE